MKCRARHHLHTSYRNKLKNKRCNLCAYEFQPQTAFDRFCETCKMESEILKFSEWLPEIDVELAEKLTA